MKVFGIDPGSARTGYGCVQSDGTRHRLIVCGAITIPASNSFPEKLKIIHAELGALIARHRPDCVAIENLFHAVNARSALKLGHARGVAMLAAVEAGVPIVEYTPAEVKQSVVGYGRAEKGQVQSMIQLLLGLSRAARAVRCVRRAGDRRLPSSQDEPARRAAPHAATRRRRRAARRAGARFVLPR